MDIRVVMKRRKSTKHTEVYEEVEGTDAINTLYIRRSALVTAFETPPREITVVVHAGSVSVEE